MKQKLASVINVEIGKYINTVGAFGRAALGCWDCNCLDFWEWITIRYLYIENMLVILYIVHVLIYSCPFCMGMHSWYQKVVQNLCKTNNSTASRNESSTNFYSFCLLPEQACTGIRVPTDSWNGIIHVTAVVSIGLKLLRGHLCVQRVAC